MLGKVDSNVKGCHQNLLTEIIKYRLPTEVGSDLIKSITTDEVKASLTGISGEKALGLDGYTSHFFKKAWKL